MKYRVPHFLPVSASILLLGGCFGILTFTTFSKNTESYEELLGRISQFEESRELQAEQGRLGVKKEIWVNEGKHRLQVALEADRADIKYANSLQGKEIIEQFFWVTATLLEDSTVDGASTNRALKSARAEEAEYHYTSQTLEAANIEIEDFSPVIFSFLSSDHLSYRQGIMILSGHVKMRFPDGMVLNCGYAQFDEKSRHAHFFEAVTVSNLDGSRLIADQMVLVMEEVPRGGGSIAQEVLSLEATGNVVLSKDQQWSLTADAARYDKMGNLVELSVKEDPDAYLFFADSRGKIHARHAVFDLHSQECLLMGDVKMVHREGPLEQYALADRVKMIKGEKEIRFFSDQGKRVLFYDKINRLQMSAPEISVLKDSQKNKNTVTGKGKVRFHFKDEEYDRLRQYFLIEKVNE